MSMMNMPMPYGGTQGPAFNSIVKRPLSDAERQLGVGYYKTIQRALRGVALVSLILFVLNTYVLTGFSDVIMLDGLSMTMTILMVVMGVVAIAMSANALVIRKKVSDAMNDGIGIEVSGPAYRSGGMQKVQSWTVGPVSLMANREAMGILREGAQTTVLCIPRLKAVLTINNYGLKNGIRVMFPPNLEAMAAPMGFTPMPMGAQPTMAPGFGYNQAVPQGPPTQSASPDEELPPPPPDL